VRLLLDTHVLLWWLNDDARLGSAAKDLIAERDNGVIVSVVSLWEILVKVRIGKLTANIVALERCLIRDDFARLAILPAHLAALAGLPKHHRDPFDHLLVAQAISENAVFVSDDEIVGRYPVTVQRCR
jgi:PIN domain nuclease of toxin-antitoxin system